MIKIHADIDVKNVKRLYVNIGMNFSCPQCGTDASYNKDRYLSYICVGDKEKVDFYCEKCDDYFLVPMVIKSCKIELDCYPEEAKMDK